MRQILALKKEIQQELNKKRRSADKLNAQIDRLIEMEIEKARKKAAGKKENEAGAKKETPKGETEQKAGPS